jgi:hypothetical protein
MQPFGSAREAQLLGYGNEVPEIAMIHLAPLLQFSKCRKKTADEERY